MTAMSVLQEWPMDTQDNKDPRSLKKMVEKIHMWEDYIEGLDERPPAPVFVYIASRLLADLQGKIKNKHKLELLARLDSPVEVLELFSDPEGRHFIAYDLGNELMDKLMEIIKWEE